VVLTINSKCQTLQDIITLQDVKTIDAADKFLTKKGFKYETAYQYKGTSLTPTIFFKRVNENSEFNAYMTLEKSDSIEKYSVGYNINSVDIFNELKRQCELIPNCELFEERTNEKGAYDRYFLDGKRTYVFSINMTNKSDGFYKYWVHVFYTDR